MNKQRNIIKLPIVEEKDEVIELFEEYAKEAESIAVAMTLPDGDVAMLYFNCGFTKRLEMASHIQCDAIDLMIQNNLGERY